MKTIKQIADEIGVSKTAIRKKITPELQTKFVETVSGVGYILPEGERLIKQAFQRKLPQTKFAEVSANQFPVVSGEVSTLIAMLQKELDIKNEQIRELNARLAEANAAIITAQKSAHAEQVLHADTKGMLPPDAREPKKQEVQTTGFFADFFRKRKKSNDS